jgi:hypothetical protein
MGGITIGGGGFTAADQEKLNKRMADKAKAEHDQEQTNADVKKVKDYMYYGKEQTVGKDAPYSRFRDPSGGMARDKLESRGVDTDSLITGKASANEGYKKGGSIKSSASKRADGIAQRGKTRGTMVMCMGGKTK